MRLTYRGDPDHRHAGAQHRLPVWLVPVGRLLALTVARLGLGMALHANRKPAGGPQPADRRP
jgi:type VI protein secretion system component VasF